MAQALFRLLYFFYVLIFEVSKVNLHLPVFPSRVGASSSVVLKVTFFIVASGFTAKVREDSTHNPALVGRFLSNEPLEKS